MSEPRTVAVVVAGRVQGVGYRAWTLREASRLGLDGRVRNRSDGAVEAVFRGAPDAVAAMLEACRHGPPGARVDGLTVTEGGPVHLAPGFRIAE